MIKILFFAQTREIIGINHLEYAIDAITVSSLREQLSLQGDKWVLALKDSTVLCAVNKKIVDDAHCIYDGDEVAFFPPVTGG